MQPFDGFAFKLAKLDDDVGNIVAGDFAIAVYFIEQTVDHSVRKIALILRHDLDGV